MLWALQLGTIERIRKDYQKSTDCFDKAEEMLKFFDEQSKIGDAIGSTIASDNVVPYKGEEYDGVMINVYKALNFMAEGEMDLARVEFNRALDRQRRAKEKFSEEISKLKSELEQKQQQNKFSKSNVENPKTRQLLAQKYPNLYNFEAYPDFVNPFANYLAGVYFNLVGDHSKAAYLLKESYGMVGNNAYIAEDLSVTEGILDGKEQLENTIWLIFENGLGPVKKEFRIDLPLFLATNKVKYVGIALPKLEFRYRAYPYLVAKVNGKDYKTCLVSDMNRVIHTEFAKDFNGTLTRAIISATAKAVAQYALEEEGSAAASIASLVVAVYSFASTAADVRMWTTLPKDFQIARFRKPKNGKLIIASPGPTTLDIDIPKCNNAIVYVRITTNQALPVYEVITF
ncbi:MAG: COG3014 family protein [Planctomycetota bacterium]